MRLAIVCIFLFSAATGLTSSSWGQNTFDWGDAPTLNGHAFHTAVGPMLGTLRDTEAISLNTPGADGDDLDGVDDDDGVLFLGPFIPGQVTQVQVTVTGVVQNNTRISAYFDWTGNNHWNHLTNELGIHNQLVSNGVNLFNVTVPTNAVEGLAYVRVKLYQGNFPGTPASGMHSNGEVEDYRIQVGEGVAVEEKSWSFLKTLFIP